MKITSIASSSAGNCYVVESQGKQLLIDCGVPVLRIREKIGGFENVVGCLISHEHGDHAGFVDQLQSQTSIPVFDSFTHHQLVNISPFKVWPLMLFHDVECFGFLVTTKTEKLFYATDTCRIPYKINGLTHLMIEANFDWKLIADSEANDVFIRRTVANHLDIDSTIDFIKRHPSLQEIHLLHLSDRNSNAQEFRERAIEASGVPVFVAEK